MRSNSARKGERALQGVIRRRRHDFRLFSLDKQRSTIYTVTESMLYSTPEPSSAKAQPSTVQTYRVEGVGRPGGHGRIRCNATDVKADTGSISDGYRPGPAELLCASLAACLLKNIERYSELLPFDYQVAAVEVEAEREDNPPKMIRCVTG